MSLKPLFTFALIASSLVLLAWLAPVKATAGPVAQIANHGLSTAQIAHIKSLGIKVLVPGYLPPGFRLSRFDSQPRSGPDSADAPLYRLVYQGPGAQEFYLCGGETCSWGADDSSASWRETLALPLFSRPSLLRYGPDDPARSLYNTAHNLQLTSGESFEFGSPDAERGKRRVSHREALRILKGLRLL